MEQTLISQRHEAHMKAITLVGIISAMPTVIVIAALPTTWATTTTPPAMSGYWWRSMLLQTWLLQTWLLPVVPQKRRHKETQLWMEPIISLMEEANTSYHAWVKMIGWTSETRKINMTLTLHIQFFHLVEALASLACQQGLLPYHT